MIVDPITRPPTASIATARKIMREYNVSGIPIVEAGTAGDGAVVVRKRMRVTLSCDHRIIDGATGAKFLQTLRRLVENPLMLL